jgi:hypothetical protein
MAVSFHLLLFYFRRCLHYCRPADLTLMLISSIRMAWRGQHSSAERMGGRLQQRKHTYFTRHRWSGRFDFGESERAKWGRVVPRGRQWWEDGTTFSRGGSS